MRRNADPASSFRLALTLLLAAAAVVVPSSLVAESSSSVVIAWLALALVGVERVAGMVVVPSVLAPAYALDETAETPLHRPGRVTDSAHHPIRPRAPGA